MINDHYKTEIDVANKVLKKGLRFPTIGKKLLALIEFYNPNSEPLG